MRSESRAVQQGVGYRCYGSMDPSATYATAIQLIIVDRTLDTT
jgi:hypothetical protein